MKKNKKILAITLILAIIIFAIIRFALANNENEPQTRIGETKVEIVRDKDDEKLMHIRLAMADGVNDSDELSKEDRPALTEAASVASFQIGLNVDIDEHVKANFQFSDELNNQDNKKLIKSEYDKENGKLYIYYVGTQELNDPRTSEPLDIGTLSFEIGKDSQGNDIETSINVSPIENFTTAASIGHDETKIASVDSVDYVVNRPEWEAPDGDLSQKPNEDTTNPDNGNTPPADSKNEGNTTGGGNTTDSEDSNTTDGENTTGDNTTGNDNTTGSENTVGGDNTTENGNTATDGNTSEDNTSDGNNSSTNANFATGDGNSSGADSNNGSTKGASGYNSGSSNEKQDASSQSEESEKPSSNNQKQSFVNKITNKIKTGGNRSLKRFIIPLVILIVLAIIVVFLKIRDNKKKKSKH